MKILIVGAKGMLGSELAAVLGRSHSVTAWDIEEIDIADRRSTIEKVRTARPDLILNSAALVDVDACEEKSELAWGVNAMGAQNLALAARSLSCSYLLISTDYVFDGATSSDYDEFATTRPINVYGASKLAGERLALQLCSATYVVRTSWLFGHRANNYVDRVLTQAKRDGVVRMATDQLECPTYTVHLAQGIDRLIATGAFGVYNVTGAGGCTRAEFAEFIVAAAGRSEQVERIDTSQIKRKARRPSRIVLDGRLFRLATGAPMPDWRDGVRAYLAREAQQTRA